MIKIETKNFQELSTDELYSILQLRSAIFVVEQDCVYQDLDGKDAFAIHVLGKKEGELVAYTRIFAPGAYFKEASIGRVAVKKQERQFGYGREIMLASIKAVQDYFKVSKIHLIGTDLFDQILPITGICRPGGNLLGGRYPPYCHGQNQIRGNCLYLDGFFVAQIQVFQHGIGKFIMPFGGDDSKPMRIHSTDGVQKKPFRF